MEDVEQSNLWLKGLWELNETIATTGERLHGNLCYRHSQTNFRNSAPLPQMRPKRDRLRMAVAGRKRLLEVGVNGGHSAYIALSANPDLLFYGVDIGAYSYVSHVISTLRNQFPGRVSFLQGNSLEALPELARNKEFFDAFHIDGAKHLYFKDVLNCARMIDGDSGSVIVDDTNLQSVAWVWRTCVRYGLIRQDLENPPGPPGAEYQSGSGILQTVPDWKWKLLAQVHSNVPPLVARVRRQVS